MAVSIASGADLSPHPPPRRGEGVTPQERSGWQARQQRGNDVGAFEKTPSSLASSAAYPERHRPGINRSESKQPLALSKKEPELLLWISGAASRWVVLQLEQLPERIVNGQPRREP